MASLSAFFGFLAAVLAMIGLYGVVSFMVVHAAATRSACAWRWVPPERTS